MLDWLYTTADWLRKHPILGWSMLGVSIVTYLGTFIAVPYIVVRIPPDYFKHREPPPHCWRGRHPVIRLSVLIAKNFLGIILVAVGIVQSIPVLVPGFGLPTILIGVLLLNFPGKRTLELWLVSRQPVLRAINWMRTRNHRPPLEVFNC